MTSAFSVAITVIRGFLVLYRFSGIGGLVHIQSWPGTSSTHGRSKKAAGLSQLYPRDVRQAEPGFGGWRGRGGFRRTRTWRHFVARGGGAGGCGAWRLWTPSGSASLVEPQLPARPARRWVWSPRREKGAAGGREVGTLVLSEPNPRLP